MDLGRPEAGGEGDGPGPVSVLVWAAWFGLAGGAAELAAFLAKCHYFDPRNYNVSRQFPWMFPAAGLLVMAGPGLALAAVARARPRWVTAGRAAGLLAFPAYFGVLTRGPIATAACLILAAGLAVRTGALVAPRAARFDRFARRGLVGMGLVLAAAAVTLHDSATEAPVAAARPSAPNVLLIVLDTVRAESLSLYGYGRDTTPNLARHAARGVRFDRAFSTAPWTAPSHASLFTGKWAHELSVGWDRPLDAETPTLASFLSARGYDTAGFVANVTYCGYETGLARGFARYDDYDVNVRAVLLCSGLVRRALNFAEKHPTLARVADAVMPPGANRKDAARVNRDFLSWLDTRPADRPFFAFLNYYDAHHPYLIPEPGDELASFREPPETRRSGRDPAWNPPGHDPAYGANRPGTELASFGEPPRRESELASFGEPPGRGSELASFGEPPRSAEDFRMLRGWWGLDKRRLVPRDVRVARDAYDRCISYLDGYVGRLLEDLGRRGVLDDTLVVITADHGEHLGERNLFGHGTSLYRAELHVPLVVIPPGGVPGGRVVREPVSLRDVPATVVGHLGLGGSPFPGRALPTGPGSDGVVGEPVQSALQGPPEDDPNQGESPACRGPMRSVVAWGRHYVRGGDGKEELFAVEGDPRERHDLAGTPEAAGTLERFRAVLRR